ncbi:MAG: hypothetical protein KDK70_38235, partial [Myxococcales bacterium]|nr:hypothetical protein [Myxococcales bacterium]
GSTGGSVGDSGDEPPPSTSWGGGDRIKRRPPTVSPETPVKTACTLQLSGIPLPTARNLAIRVGVASYEIQELTMGVEFEGPYTAVRVTDKRYTASRRITREECLAGPVPVTIRPRAARVTFVGGDDRVVVVCKAGCRPTLIETNQDLATFQAVPVPEGELQVHVVLQFKRTGYEPLVLEEDLLPGPNTIQLSMIPR